MTVIFRHPTKDETRRRYEQEEDTTKQEDWKKRLEEIISENSDIEFVKHRTDRINMKEPQHEEVARIFFSKSDRFVVAEVEQRFGGVVFQKVMDGEDARTEMTYWVIDLEKRFVRKLDNIEKCFYRSDRRYGKEQETFFFCDSEKTGLQFNFPLNTVVSDAKIDFSSFGDRDNIPQEVEFTLSSKCTARS